MALTSAYLSTSMKIVFNIIPTAAAVIVNFMAGGYAVQIGGTHARLYANMVIKEEDLPALTRMVLSYTSSAAPVFVGVLLGLGSLIGLSCARRSEKYKWLTPFLLTISFVAAILHLISVIQGVTLPLFRITYSMGNF